MDRPSELSGRLTMVIIAHRLSTVEDCDMLVWLDKGRVREIGPPNEILPVYRAEMNERSN